MALVTITDFKRQLGLTGFTTDDALLQMKLEQATELVLAYIRRSDDQTQATDLLQWSADPQGGSPPDLPVPWNVHAAILQWATELYRFRGDEADEVTREHPGDPSPTVKALLHRDGRRPVFA